MLNFRILVVQASNGMHGISTYPAGSAGSKDPRDPLGPSDTGFDSELGRHPSGNSIDVYGSHSCLRQVRFKAASE